MKYLEKVITKIAELTMHKSNPLNEYSEDIFVNQLAELSIFNYSYAWLFILENDKVELTDSNITRFQLGNNIVANKITSQINSKINGIEFLKMFEERYRNHLKDLENFKKYGKFPKYLFLRMHSFPMENYDFEIEEEYEEFYNSIGVNENQFVNCYIKQINFLQTTLESIN